MSSVPRENYNGWTNYETWLVNLWMTADAGSAGYWESVARDIYEATEAEAPFTRSEHAGLLLSDAIKERIDEENPLAEAGLYTDLLTSALSEVNWYEIAAHFIADVEEVPSC
jgi:hypothetical protein